jgi:uncharacterized protein with ParB-like and HNH nuclease domain
MANSKFLTEIYSIEKLKYCRFIIPSYQRPYVWGYEQINKLLSDFYEAYSRPETYDYYIGTVLLNKPDNTKEIYQLVDGQQRFTTLWLIAVAFKILKSNSDIEKFLKVGDDLRLDFAIRKQIKAYLLTLIEKQENEKSQYSDAEVEKDDYLVHIANAITIIIGKIKTLEFLENKSLHDFGNYIYKNVYFVANTVPKKTDLNKLFATINNSGVQLEQHDILKSLLLQKLTTEKTIYSKIWEACENMNNYFERNVKKLFPTEFNWDNINFDALKDFNLNNLENTKKWGDNSYTISDILSDNVIQGEDEREQEITYPNDQKEDNNVYCRSIIKFPQLLLHTYRIFLKQQGNDDFTLPFHSNNLLRIFKPLSDELDENIIKQFFKCLWTVRFLFDKCIVKWRQIDDDKEEDLLLTSISKSENAFVRKNTTEPSEVSQLQCMLYHTGNYNTQIWLTPYLKKMIDNADALNCLEEIDNKLSLSMLSDKETSFNLMEENYMLPINKTFDFEKYLRESNGTSFRHYWFQKLEYILWKEFNKDDKINIGKFKNYRITSKNSVEHVFPRNHIYGEELDTNLLNSFGNLALLNVSQNSSYSNMTIIQKKEKFDYQVTYDSLKLKMIYEQSDLKNYKEVIIPHRDLMIEKIKRHYSS